MWFKEGWIKLICFLANPRSNPTWQKWKKFNLTQPLTKMKKVKPDPTQPKNKTNPAQPLQFRLRSPELLDHLNDPNRCYPDTLEYFPWLLFYSWVFYSLKMHIACFPPKKKKRQQLRHIHSSFRRSIYLLIWERRNDPLVFLINHASNMINHAYNRNI